MFTHRESPLLLMWQRTKRRQKLWLSTCQRWSLLSLHSSVALPDAKRLATFVLPGRPSWNTRDVWHFCVQLGSAMEDIIGESAVDLDGRFQTVRTAESNLGNFVCDCWRIASGADLVILNRYEN